MLSNTKIHHVVRNARFAVSLFVTKPFHDGPPYVPSPTGGIKLCQLPKPVNFALISKLFRALSILNAHVRTAALFLDVT